MASNNTVPAGFPVGKRITLVDKKSVTREDGSIDYAALMGKYKDIFNNDNIYIT
jgi:hypothetical protein